MFIVAAGWSSAAALTQGLRLLLITAVDSLPHHGAESMHFVFHTICGPNNTVCVCDGGRHFLKGVPLHLICPFLMQIMHIVRFSGLDM